MNKHTRVWIALWCLIALSPLSLLLVLLWVTLLHQPQPVNTGDALLDAYLQAAVDENLLLRSMRNGDLSRWHSLSEQKWQSIEQRFGDDPRYWMLRFNLDAEGEAHLSPVAGVNVASKLRLLELARARGCANWTALLKLINSYENAWTEEAQERLGLTHISPSSKTPAGQRYEYRHQIRLEVDRRHGTVLKQLLIELSSAGADQALVHYLLAQIACERGDFPGAITELQAGNTAPKNECAIGYPLDNLRQAAAQSRPLADDHLLAGYLARWNFVDASQETIRVKDTVRVLSEWAANHNDRQALHTIYGFGCRFSTVRNGSMLQSMVGLVMAGTARKAWEQVNPHPDQHVQQAMADAKSLHTQLINSYKSLNASSPLTGITVTGQVRQWLAGLACGEGYQGVTADIAWSAELIAEQQALTTHIADYFRQLEQLPLWD